MWLLGVMLAPLIQQMSIPASAMPKVTSVMTILVSRFKTNEPYKDHFPQAALVLFDVSATFNLIVGSFKGVRSDWTCFTLIVDLELPLLCGWYSNLSKNNAKWNMGNTSSKLEYYLKHLNIYVIFSWSKIRPIFQVPVSRRNCYVDCAFVVVSQISWNGKC